MFESYLWKHKIYGIYWNIIEITCDTTTAATGTSKENVSASPSSSINALSTATSTAQGTEWMNTKTSSLDFRYFVDFLSFSSLVIVDPWFGQWHGVNKNDINKINWTQEDKRHQSL